MKGLIENQFFKDLCAQFKRSPLQINQLMQADAELLRLENHTTLAITTDCIVEEIETGLYTSPYHIGWMVITVNL